jgi:hypothetical protein
MAEAPLNSPHTERFVTRNRPSRAKGNQPETLNLVEGISYVEINQSRHNARGCGWSYHGRSARRRFGNMCACVTQCMQPLFSC